MYGDNFDEVFSSIKQDDSYKNSVSKKTNLSGKDLDDYMKDESQFEPDWDNFNSEEDDPDYTPMKRKTVSVKKPDGSEVKQTTVKPRSNIKSVSEEVGRLEGSSQRLDEARKKRDTEKADFANKRKELRAQAKDNMRGREGMSYAKPVNSTDLYLDILIDNKKIHDYTGKRTSKETGLDLTRVVKKGEEYFFDDGTHGKLQKKNDTWTFEDGTKPETATPYEYTTWSKGSNKEVTKSEGKGLDKRLINSIQTTAYKKLIQDMFTPEEFEAIRGSIKNERLAGITDLSYSNAEETVINELYKPIVEGGEQDTQARKIFADAWAQAENKAKSEFARIANTDAVKAANAENKENTALWKDIFDRENKASGDGGREAKVLRSANKIGIKVSGEGANTKYIGQVEKDEDGKKWFRMYEATGNNNRARGTTAEAWFANHSPDMYRDQVFSLELGDNGMDDNVIQQAANWAEANLKQVSGKYTKQNAKIKAAQDNMIRDMYFGKNLIEFLNEDKGEERTNRILKDKGLLKNQLEQLHRLGMDVSPDDFTIGPVGSFEKDLLTQIQEKEDSKRGLRGQKTKEEMLGQGYVEQEDGRMLKQYKPDNPNTKTNRAKVSKVSYGAGSTVKDKKTGRYYGETAQAERERSLSKKPDVKPALGLLDALRSKR